VRANEAAICKSKHQYYDKKEAKNALANVQRMRLISRRDNESVEIRAYRCHVCRRYHLTHLES
jgi:hypothetical protein